MNSLWYPNIFSSIPTGFFFGYIYLNPNAKPINAGIIGVILNVILSYGIDYLWFGKQVQSSDDDDISKERYRPAWDIPQFARFGEGPLTFELMNKMMGSFPEPMRSVAFNLFFFLSVSIITPLVAGKSAFVLFYHVNVCAPQYVVLVI